MSGVIVFLTWVITYLISKSMLVFDITDLLVEVYDKGYKFDMDKIKGDNIEVQENRNEFEEKLYYFLILIPVINIIATKNRMNNLKKEFLKQTEDMVIPMTEEELKNYGSMITKSDKYTYGALISGKKGIDEFEKYKRKEGILLNLRYHSLPSHAYTFDEVKRLNEVTDNNYIVGKMEDINIAIIGIDNNELINSIKLGFRDKNIIYNFQGMDDDEAKDKTFVVYPFNSELEDDEKLMECYEDIVNTRLGITNSKITNKVEEFSYFKVLTLRKKLRK